ILLSLARQIEHAAGEVERDFRKRKIGEGQLVAERLVDVVSETGNHTAGAAHDQAPRLEFAKSLVAPNAFLHGGDVVEKPASAGVLREKRDAVRVVEGTRPVSMVI